MELKYKTNKDLAIEFCRRIIESSKEILDLENRKEQKLEYCITIQIAFLYTFVSVISWLLDDEKYYPLIADIVKCEYIDTIIKNSWKESLFLSYLRNGLAHSFDCKENKKEKTQSYLNIDNEHLKISTIKIDLRNHANFWYIEFQNVDNWTIVNFMEKVFDMINESKILNT